MTDVLAEIDEVMRQERLQKIWQEWGSAIITGIVVLLITTGGLSAYNAWDERAKEKQTGVFLQVIEDDNFPAGVDINALEMRGNLKALTALMAAGQLAEDGQSDEAIAFYKTASDMKGASADYRDLGFVMGARLSGATDEDTIKGLSKIFKNKKSPWRYQAGVDLAVLSFHNAQNQDVDAAKDYLNAVIVAAQDPDNKVPNTLADRAKKLLHVYTTRGAQHTDTQENAE